MKISTLHDILKSGKQPIVRFGEGFGESIDYPDALPTKGMVAKIIRFFEKDDNLHCFCDFSIAREHNIHLMREDWALSKKQEATAHRKCGNALEAGAISKDLIDPYYFDLSDESDFPLEIVEENTSMSYYVKLCENSPSFKKPYLEWLEEEWTCNNAHLKQMITFK
jgi:hypothetical protein